MPKQYLRTSGILQLSQRHSIPRVKIGRNQKWAQSWTAYISKIFFNISLWKPYNCPVECQSNICAQVEFSNYLNGIRFPVRKLVEIRNGPSLERLIFQKYFLIFPFENLIIAQWSAKAIFAHKWNFPIISTAFDSPSKIGRNQKWAQSWTLIFQKYFLIFPFENLIIAQWSAKAIFAHKWNFPIISTAFDSPSKIGRNQKWAQSWTDYISKIFFNISLWKPYNCPVECQSNICAQVEFSNYLNGIRFPVRKLVEIRNGPSLESAYISKIFFNISLWKPYNCPVECQSNICAQVEFSNYLNGIRFPVRKLVEIKNGPSLESIIFQKYFLIFPFENLIIAQWSAKAIFAHKWNFPIISTAFDSPSKIGRNQKWAQSWTTYISKIFLNISLLKPYNCPVECQSNICAQVEFSNYLNGIRFPVRKLVEIRNGPSLERYISKIFFNISLLKPYNCPVECQSNICAQVEFSNYLNGIRFPVRKLVEIRNGPSLESTYISKIFLNISLWKP